MLSTACELCTYLLLLVPSTLPSLESDAYRHEITTIGGKKKKEEKQKTRKQRKDPQNKYRNKEVLSRGKNCAPSQDLGKKKEIAFSPTALAAKRVTVQKGLLLLEK